MVNQGTRGMYWDFDLDYTPEHSQVHSQSMLLPIMSGRTAGASMGHAIVQTISSRMACGGKELIKEPLRVRPLDFILLLVYSLTICVLGHRRYA